MNPDCTHYHDLFAGRSGFPPFLHPHDGTLHLTEAREAFAVDLAVAPPLGTHCAGLFTREDGRHTLLDSGQRALISGVFAIQHTPQDVSVPDIPVARRVQVPDRYCFEFLLREEIYTSKLITSLQSLCPPPNNLDAFLRSIYLYARLGLLIMPL